MNTITPSPQSPPSPQRPSALDLNRKEWDNLRPGFVRVFLAAEDIEAIQRVRSAGHIGQAQPSVCLGAHLGDYFQKIAAKLPLVLFVLLALFPLRSSAQDLQIRHANDAYVVVTLREPFTWPITALTTLQTTTNVAGPWRGMPAAPNYTIYDTRYWEIPKTNAPQQYFRAASYPVGKAAR